MIQRLGPDGVALLALRTGQDSAFQSQLWPGLTVGVMTRTTQVSQVLTTLVSRRHPFRTGHGGHGLIFCHTAPQIKSLYFLIFCGCFWRRTEITDASTWARRPSFVLFHDRVWMRTLNRHMLSFSSRACSLHLGYSVDSWHGRLCSSAGR